MEWFILTIASVAYEASYSYSYNPEMTAMKWGWLLNSPCMGPLTLALYILSSKEPAPSTHEEFVKPL